MFSNCLLPTFHSPGSLTTETMSELELVTCQGARVRGSTAATHLVQRLVMV